MPVRRSLALLLLAATSAAGCACGSASGVGADGSMPADDSNAPDADFPDAQPGPELCTDGIRRVDVALPSVTAGSNPDWLVGTSRAWVGPDEVLAARVDQLANAQFVRIDPRDGAIRASGVGRIPGAIDLTQAFRRLPDGSTEVLFTGARDATTYFATATFDASATLVAARSIPTPTDTEVDELQFVVGAAATARGFVLLARGAAHGGDAHALLVDIRDGVMRYEPTGAVWPDGSLEGGPVALVSASQETAWFAVGVNEPGLSIASGVIVGRLDTSAVPFAPATVLLPILRGGPASNVVRVHVMSDGTAVLGVTGPDRLVLAWLDVDLSLLGEWSYPIDAPPPILGEAAGTLVDQALVLRVDDQVRVARAFGPGVVAGGLRPLLDGTTTEVSYFGPRDGFGAVGEAFVLATWAPDLSLVTFCGSP